MRRLAPVGDAEVPLPAVRFMDCAGTLGQVTDAMDSGLVALVDRSGAVVTCAPVTGSDDALRATTDALG